MALTTSKRTRLCAALCAAAALAGAGVGVAEAPKVEEGGAQPPAECASEDARPRRWRVDAPGGATLHRAPDHAAERVATAPQDALLSDLDCVEADGRVWRRVQLFQGAARGYASADLLAPARGPDGIVPIGADDSARRARRRDFDARGEMRCAQEAGRALSWCAAAVARGGGGDATLVATFSNGFARTLFFSHGAFLRANPTMSGVGTDTEWRIEDDRYIIRVDDQRFEPPIDLVIGARR